MKVAHLSLLAPGPCLYVSHVSHTVMHHTFVSRDNCLPRRARRRINSQLLRDSTSDASPRRASLMADVESSDMDCNSLSPASDMLYY